VKQPCNHSTKWEERVAFLPNNRDVTTPSRLTIQDNLVSVRSEPAENRRNRLRTWLTAGGKEGDATRLSLGGMSTQYLRNLGGAAVVICLALTACAQNAVIRHDPGGLVYQHALKVAKLRDSGEQVKILGLCASACTLHLSLPNICVGKRARFEFHAAYGAGVKGNAYATKYLMRSYPVWVRNWIASQGGLSGRVITMRGSYARKFVGGC
jgi:hypothetical protein